MRLMDTLGRLFRLGTLFGLALGATAVSVCSRAPHVGTTPDAQTTQDGSVDAGVGDAAADADADAEQPDARLWDVLCE